MVGLEILLDFGTWGREDPLGLRGGVCGTDGHIVGRHTSPERVRARPGQHRPRARPLGTRASGRSLSTAVFCRRSLQGPAPRLVGQTRGRVSFASSNAPLPLRPSPCPCPQPPGPSLHVTPERGAGPGPAAARVPTARAGPHSALQRTRGLAAEAGLGRPPAQGGAVGTPGSNRPGTGH